MEIITREAAKLKGLKLFFTGVPCKRGHASARYVSNGHCKQCAFDCMAERPKQMIRAAVARHYVANRAEILDKKRLYYAENRETVKARSQAYRDKQRALKERR